jgi:hypothetical protein
MIEAGQIFALLRSFSAAEVARRFNAPQDGMVLTGRTQSATGGDPGGSRGSVEGRTPSDIEANRASAGRNVGVGAGALGGAAASRPAPDLMATGPGGAASPDPADQPAALRTGPLRMALSLGHLAPPRSDLARLFAEAALTGQPRSGAPLPMAGILGAASAPGGGLTGAAQPGTGQAAKDEGSLPVTPAPRGGRAAAPVPPLGIAPTAPAMRTGEAVDPVPARTMASPDHQPGRLVPTTAAALAEGRAIPAAVDGKALADAPGGNISDPAAPMGTAAPAADSRPVSPRATAAQLAFAEVVMSLVDVAGPGRAGATSLGSGVIFNAAMIPGWPYPSAFARDGAEAINPKALLHRLAAAVEGMSPEEAAAYLAKLGGGYAFLQRLRKLLKELDEIEAEEVKGLLFAFLETISTIASGLQKALQQLAESAALQEAVVHGDDPGPGRRRIRL